jgi:hypothetical protein
MMKSLLCALALAGMMSGQEAKVCKTPRDNVYRDGPCEMYHHCDWSGSKYRAEGHCFKVTVDAAETSTKNFHRTVVDLCSDTTGKPRNCQKEFDEQFTESSAEDACYQRRFRTYEVAFYDHIGNGGTFFPDDEKRFVEEQTILDRARAERDCTQPKIQTAKMPGESEDVAAIQESHEEEYGNSGWCNSCNSWGACTLMACDPHTKHKVTVDTCVDKAQVLLTAENGKKWCHKVKGGE